MLPEPSEERGKALPLLPLVVLASIVLLFFYALSEIVPPLIPADHAALPRVTRLLPLLTRKAFLSSLALLVLGGGAYLLAPKDDPIRVAAWFLAGGALIALWGAILVLIPKTCFTVEVPLP